MVELDAVHLGGEEQPGGVAPRPGIRCPFCRDHPSITSCRGQLRRMARDLRRRLTGPRCWRSAAQMPGRTRGGTLARAAACHGSRTAYRLRPERGSLGKTHLVRWQGGLVSVRGVLQVHSAPPALCPHIEWAVAGIIGVPVRLPWVDQPAAPGTVRAELDWQGRAGTVGHHHLGPGRLEPAAVRGDRGGQPRLRRGPLQPHAVPGHVLARSPSASGDILVPEGRLRAAMTARRCLGARPGPGRQRPGPAWTRCASGTARAIPRSAARWRPSWPCCSGQPWDDELEPFRHAADGAPVRWLHATG